jgi:hypothetical protein
MKGGFQDEWIREVYLEIVEASQVIGTATVYVIDADSAEAADKSMYFVCDDFDQNTYNCGDAVYDMAGRANEFRPAVRRTFNIEPWDSLNVSLLSQVEIELPYRGCCFRLPFLKPTIRQWLSRLGFAEYRTSNRVGRGRGIPLSPSGSGRLTKESNVIR